MIVFLSLLLSTTFLSLKAETSVLYSRISKIVDIKNESGQGTENHTQFLIEVEVEILNTADENRSIIFPDFRVSRVKMELSLRNHSLSSYVKTPTSFPVFTNNTYSPGITTESSFVRFCVNQTNRELIPDGNYSLWRQLSYSYSSNDTSAFELRTNFTATLGTLNITYAEFNWLPTDNISKTYATPLIFFIILTIICPLTKKRKINNS